MRVVCLDCNGRGRVPFVVSKDIFSRIYFNALYMFSHDGMIECGTCDGEGNVQEHNYKVASSNIVSEKRVIN